MREIRSGLRIPSQRLIAAALVCVGVGVSSVALGLPWDIDMADGTQRKAYSFDMGGLPDGVVAQPAITSPRGYAPNFARGTPEGEALANPFGSDEATIARGKAMFQIYCQPCHGDGKVLGPIAGPVGTRVPGVATLAGPNGTVHGLTDGYVYLTIRNGGNVMPSYGWALADDELWAVVSYVRTLDNAAYKPATPAVAPEPAPDEGGDREGRRERRGSNP